MSEQDDTPVGKLLANVHVCDMRIVDDEIPAITLGKKRRRGIRATVPAMIMGTHDDAEIVRRLCETIVAVDVLAHPVQQLYDTDDVAIRSPYA